MRPVKVLIVDDALVVRRLVSRALADDEGIEVVGVAGSGRLALTKIPHCRPDIVVLDVEMPGLNGLETLAAIREDHPQIKVIMFSRLTDRGARVTIEALSNGAADYLKKPSADGDVAESLGFIRRELTSRIKLIGGYTSPLDSGRKLELGGWQVKTPPPPVPLTALAVGSSTGGPSALAELLDALPGDLGVPIFIVQHMPAAFTGFLARRLDERSAFTVREARAWAEPGPGEVWIAPGDRHMLLRRGDGKPRITIDRGPPVRSCRPSVDLLFSSVAEVYGGGALGMVLTGMGRDGLDGARQMRDAGASILVQDRGSAVVWGMPGHIAEAGLAERVGTVGELAGEVIRRARRRGGARTR